MLEKYLIYAPDIQRQVYDDKTDIRLLTAKATTNAAREYPISLTIQKNYHKIQNTGQASQNKNTRPLDYLAN